MYIPKLLNFSVPSLWLTAMCLVSCSSEEIRTEPSPIIHPSNQTVTLKFALGEYALTKADDSENKIEKLSLAFFNFNNGSPLFLQNVEATHVEDNYYIASVGINPTLEPDMVIAFVNISAPTFLNNSFPSASVKSVVTESGDMIMTTPRFFDENNIDTYYQIFDYTSSDPIELELERIAAKVSVKKSDEVKLTPIVLKALDGNEITLSLSLNSWGITASDTETYLLRQIGTYGDMNSLFSNWPNWNDNSKNELNWSYSFNYTTNDYSKLNLIKFSEANCEFGKDYFSHESTRPLGIEETNNSRPSVVLVGEYTINDNETPSTFYKMGSYIFNEDELKSTFIKRAVRSLRMNEGLESWINTTLTIELIDGSNNPYVALQSKGEINLNGLTKKDGTSFSDLDDLNSYLQAECGIAEMFKDGKCYFTIPIRHEKIDNSTLYGLVRNHHYDLSIQSISGMGTGVASDEQVMGDIDPINDNRDTYEITFSINIRDWNTIEQDINIEKTR